MIFQIALRNRQLVQNMICVDIEMYLLVIRLSIAHHQLMTKQKGNERARHPDTGSWHSPLLALYLPGQVPSGRRQDPHEGSTYPRPLPICTTQTVPAYRMLDPVPAPVPLTPMSPLETTYRTIHSDRANSLLFFWRSSCVSRVLGFPRVLLAWLRSVPVRAQHDSHILLPPSWHPDLAYDLERRLLSS